MPKQWWRGRGQWGGILVLSALMVVLLARGGQGGAAQSQAPGPLTLADYPRPTGDNGWGMHWAPGAAAAEPAAIHFQLHELQRLHVRWVVLLNDGLTPSQDATVEALVAAGIEPILRIHLRYNDELDLRPQNPQSAARRAGLRALVEHYRARGVDYFLLPPNEPNLQGEPGGWRDGQTPDPRLTAALWVAAAQVVAEGGGYPGTVPMAPGGHVDDMLFARVYFQTVMELDPATLNRAWVAVHNYGLNHPPTYPDDPVNQEGVPLSAEERAPYGAVGDVDETAMNRLRRERTNPGDTLREDSNGFRKYEALHALVQELVGRTLPILSTEGGWGVGSCEDARYLCVTPEVQAAWTREVYSGMATAPEWFFVHTSWILTNFAGNGTTPMFEAQAWYKSRCTTAEVGRALSVEGAKVLPPCQAGEVLPVARVLAGLAPALRPPPRQVELAPAPQDEATPLVSGAELAPFPFPYVFPLADAPASPGPDGSLVVSPHTWEAVEQVATAFGLTPEEVLARLYPSRDIGRVQVVDQPLVLQSPDPTLQIDQEGQVVRFTNLADEARTFRLGETGTEFALDPGGSAVMGLPDTRRVQIATTARPVPLGSDVRLTTVGEALVAPDGGHTFGVVALRQRSCQPAQVQVRVEDGGGRGLAGMPVTLATLDGQRHQEGVTDEGGRIMWPVAQPPGGRWQVRVAGPRSSQWVGELRTDWTDPRCPGGGWGQHAFEVVFRPLAATPPLQSVPAVIPTPPAPPTPAPPFLGEAQTATWTSTPDGWPLPASGKVGLHFVPQGGTTAAEVDEFIADLRGMGMSWAVVVYGDENTLKLAAPRFHQAGIMVLWRRFMRPYEDYPTGEIERDLAILREAGYPSPYLQLYNEPDLRLEWEEDASEPFMGDRQAAYVENWLKVARDVVHRGGYAGIQVTDPAWLRSLLVAVKAQSDPVLMERLFFVPHNYGSNHPPSYPYDAVNQAEHPGATVEEDWTGVLGFLKYARIFEEEVGRVPYFIAGEGGWGLGVHEDGRYPRMDAETHAAYHLTVVGWLRGEPLPTGTPLPDYFLAQNFWLWRAPAGPFAEAAWYRPEGPLPVVFGLKEANQR